MNVLIHCVQLENGIHKKTLRGSYLTEKHFTVPHFNVNYAQWSEIFLQKETGRHYVK